MAYIHFAYTFDWGVHRNLQNQLLENGTVNLLKLQATAKTIIQKSKATERLLGDFRYHEEWLDDSDGDDTQANYWYTIYLAQFFKENPSLSNNRFRGTHLVLDDLLPVAGWEHKEILELMLGKKAKSLSEANESQNLFQAFDFLDGHGCLSPEDVEKKLDKLQRSQAVFLGAVSIPKKINQLAFYNKMSVDELLYKAYQDTFDMLTVALNRHQFLYLFREY
jgi:hypothetical protein